MIGLCGAHRTGKSTLARAFAEREGIPFVQTSISAVYQAAGLHPADECSIEQRIAIQETILETLCKQYVQARKLSSLFIADRTPIDIASYMLADVGRQATAENRELGDLLTDYTDRCLKLAGEHFAVVVQVQPGLPLQAAELKGAMCPAYIEHLNTVQIGLMADERSRVRSYAIPRSVTDLDARVGALTKAAEAALASHKVLSQSLTIH